MSLLFRVIEAAHAVGTHHRLAFDGIHRLEGPDAEAWQRVFLKHAAVLVKGSKAPDDQFKDFKNHVLHPRDNFWGGAPDKARSWYADLVETLAKGDWPAAVWCAGVLSHYVTDPLNPFHTAQSEAENAIHRAFEWSISKSYDALKQIGNADARRNINVADGPDWLEQLICQAASDANVHYEKLIAHYDIHRGVVDPPSGLDSIAQPIVGDLIGQASAVFATVLQRAITESKMPPPEISLALDMVLATLRIPVAKLLQRLSDRAEQRTVERIYDELMATGTVEINLPEDDRAVRDLYAEEVLGRRPTSDLKSRFLEKGRRKTAETDGEKRERIKRIGARGIPAPGANNVRVTPSDPAAKELPLDEPARPAPNAADRAARAAPVGRFRGEPIASPSAQPAPPGAAAGTPEPVKAAIPNEQLQRQLALQTLPAAASPQSSQSLMSALATTSVPVIPRRDKLAATPSVQAGSEAPAARVIGNPAQPVVQNGPRVYLTPARPIVDAPSIGPKMAERLAPLGFVTVADLLAANPADVATRIAVPGIKTETVAEWQDQAQLVCAIPELRGTHAQLLVGAGFRTIEAITDADSDDLCAKVLAFATSKDGQRVLRNGDPPDLARIKSWVDNANSLKAA